MPKRSTIKNAAGTFYAKRTKSGEFKEMDEKGRSLTSDRRTKAKTKVKSGYGDQGDQARPSRSRPSSKKKAPAAKKTAASKKRAPATSAASPRRKTSAAKKAPAKKK